MKSAVSAVIEMGVAESEASCRSKGR